MTALGKWNVETIESQPDEDIQAGAMPAPIGNYYGTPYVLEQDGKFYFALANHDGTSRVEVSRRFFDAFAAEFSGVREAEAAEKARRMEHYAQQWQRIGRIQG